MKKRCVVQGPNSGFFRLKMVCLLCLWMMNVLLPVLGNGPPVYLSVSLGWHSFVSNYSRSPSLRVDGNEELCVLQVYIIGPK